MASPSRCLPALLVAFACQPGTAGTPPHRVAPTAPDAAPSSSAAREPPAASAGSAPALGAAPSAVALTLLGAGELEITAADTARVATAADIERRDEGGGWVRLENLDLGKGYRLVAQCTQSDTCSTVAQGAPLRVQPWHGLDCSAQCNGTCRANAWLGPGTFRFVVRDCEGKNPIASPAFVLPDAEHASTAAFDRWKMTEGVVRAEAMRLAHPPVRWDPQSGLAGIPAKSPVTLSAAAIASFTTLMRTPRGFDDQVRKRCVTEHWVGVRLTRQLATTGAAAREDVTEIAFDLACDKLFAVRGTGSDRPTTTTHFDPSRRAILAWAKTVFADDGELAKLH